MCVCVCVCVCVYVHVCVHACMCVCERERKRGGREREKEREGGEREGREREGGGCIHVYNLITVISLHECAHLSECVYGFVITSMCIHITWMVNSEIGRMWGNLKQEFYFMICIIDVCTNLLVLLHDSYDVYVVFIYFSNLPYCQKGKFLCKLTFH